MKIHFLQNPTKIQRGCQIDYLIQTKFNTLYVCEIKFSQRKIGLGIINEVKQKIDSLTVPKLFAFKPVLIHIHGVTNAVIEADYFAGIIDFSQFLG